MSAPEVGDRVRVIAGQWVGSYGRVTAVLSGTYLWVDVTHTGTGHVYSRALLVDEVEMVPTTRTQPPQRPEEGSGAPVEAQAADGAHRGGKR